MTVDSGPTVMAKKRAPKARSKAEDGRVAVVVLKDSLEYREWLNQISKESLIPVASIVRDALAKWAKQRGYPSPPDTSKLPNLKAGKVEFQRPEGS